MAPPSAMHRPNFSFCSLVSAKLLRTWCILLLQCSPNVLLWAATALTQFLLFVEWMEPCSNEGFSCSHIFVASILEQQSVGGLLVLECGCTALDPGICICSSWKSSRSKQKRS